jgi:hypothetical protein
MFGHAQAISGAAQVRLGVGTSHDEPPAISPFTANNVSADFQFRP